MNKDINFMFNVNGISFSEKETENKEELVLEGPFVHAGEFNGINVSMGELKKSIDKWQNVDILSGHNEKGYDNFIGNMHEAYIDEKEECLMGRFGVLDPEIKRKITWRKKLGKPINVSIYAGAEIKADKEGNLNAKDLSPDHVALVRRPADKNAEVKISFSEEGINTAKDWIELSEKENRENLEKIKEGETMVDETIENASDTVIIEEEATEEQTEVVENNDKEVIIELEEKVKTMEIELKELNEYKENIIQNEKDSLYKEIIDLGLEKEKYEDLELEKLRDVVKDLIESSKSTDHPASIPNEDRETVRDGHVKYNMDEIDKEVRKKIRGE